MTWQNVRDKIESIGIESLGIGVPQLYPQWSGVNPTYNNQNAGVNALSLQFAGAWNSPIHGMLSWHASGCANLYRLDGSALTATPPAGVLLLTLHPQAYLRLEQLIAARLGAVGTNSIRPTPRYMALQLNNPPAQVDLKTARPGDGLPAGLVTFHDNRGQIIDPLAVAAWFADLMTVYPALVPSPQTLNVNPLLIGVGGATTIAGLAGAGPTRLIHVVDPHGAPWRDPGNGQGLQTNASGANAHWNGQGALLFPAGSNVSVEAGANNVRIGWATVGAMGNAALNVPAYPGAAPVPNPARDFLRVMAVDLGWHLLGNRTTGVIGGVSGCDPSSAAEPAPAIRDGINFNPTLNAAMPDGVAWTGVMNTLLTAGGANQADWLLSPSIVPTALPATGNTRWPAAPAPAGAAGAWNNNTVGLIRTALNTAQGLQAAWSNAAPNSVDVVVTIAAGLLPAEAYVRLFPRLFVYPKDLFNGDRSFVRGDGVATISNGGAIQLLLTDPLNLGATPRPASPVLYLDLLVVPRPGGVVTQPRLFGNLQLNITGTLAPPAGPVAGGALAATGGPAVADGLAAVPANQRGVANAPIRGLTAGPTPALAIGGVNSVQTLIEFILQLGQDGNPYEAPRFPTMARNDALMVHRVNQNANASWNALITGGWFAPESVEEQLNAGRPGKSASMDVHNPAMEVDGPLAYDLALAAHRRMMALVPRINALATNAWDFPVAAANGTGAGAVLQTLAPFCDTPELGFTSLSDAQITGLPNAWVNLTNQLDTLFQDEYIDPNIPRPVPLVTLIDNLKAIPAPGGAPQATRIVGELMRELWISQRGRRDAQWAIKRAIAEARELIYIEAPHFCTTVYPDDTNNYTWDMLSALNARLTACPNLKVVIAVPEVLDYASGYNAFAQQAYDERYKALFDPIKGLISVFPSQVVAFHPMAFPGRPMHLRTTVITVDDVWGLIGTSAPSRRGLTFDGGTDVVLFDKNLRDGYSMNVRNLRRTCMAQVLGVPASAVVANPATPAASWVRLGQPASAFAVVKELLDQGGQGLISPIRQNASAISGILAADPTVADPEGRAFLGTGGATSTLTLFLNSFLAKV